MIIFSKDTIWRGITVLGLGTIVSQLINVLGQPILTRIVLPEILGIYTYVISLASIVIPVASLKLDMLIVTADDDNEAQYITDACILITLFTSLLSFIIIFICSQYPAKNIFNKFGYISYFVPIIIFTNGLRFLFISYNNRYKQFKLISKIAIIRESVRILIQILMGVLTGGVIGQIFGYIVAPLVGLRLQISEYINKLLKRPFITIDQFKNIFLVKGKSQILYLVPAQFINNCSFSFIALSISFLYSSSVLGYFSVATRVLDVPLVFITSNVSKVIYQKVNECLLKKEPVFKMVLSVITVLLFVSATAFSFLYYIAPMATGFIFGSGYEIAGYYTRCLCIMYAFRLISSSFSGLFTVFGKQKYEFWFNIMLVGISIGSFLFANIYTFNIFQYLQLIGMGYALTYASMIVGYMFLCYKYEEKI